MRVVHAAAGAAAATHKARYPRAFIDIES